MALAQVSNELIAIYFHSFEIFIIQIGDERFLNQSLLLSSQIIFRMLKKLDDFEAQVRQIDVRALVLQNHSKSIRTSARTSISRTTMRSRNVILKVVLVI
jgi:hypothetical protein